MLICIGNRHQKYHLYLLVPFICIDNLEALDSHIVAFLLLSCHFRVQRLLPVGSVVYTPSLGGSIKNNHLFLFSCSFWSHVSIVYSIVVNNLGQWSLLLIRLLHLAVLVVMWTSVLCNGGEITHNCCNK